MTAETRRYTTIAIVLHWVIAFSILALIGVGLYMHNLSNEAPQKFALYQMHKSFGITVMILTIARIAWRLMNPPPPLPEGMKSWERATSHTVHVAFYALMILMPLTGWMMVSASPTGVPTFWFGLFEWPHLPVLSTLAVETKREVAGALLEVHELLAFGTLGLLFLHVAGALKHDFVDKEGAVLRRMIPGLFGQATPPSEGRGAARAFGGALAVFAAIALIPVVTSLGGGQPAAADDAGPSGVEANWTLDYEASSIAVSGVLQGYPVPATFPNWTADIDFDETDLAGSTAYVRLDATTATANDAYLDTTLAEADWLGTADHPAIEVRVTNMREVGEAYEADIAFTLKDQTFERVMAFVLSIDGDTATMQSTVTVDRFEIGIGANADPDKSWVDAPLEVIIDVVATRGA
ncbi:MAG: cytochrome b/b6 domain-containing protein [Pseudomonadota bacterium]